MATPRFVFSIALCSLLGACAGVPTRAMLQDSDAKAAQSSESSAGSSEKGEKDWSKSLKNPVSQPTIFEAPTIQGEVRPIFIHQRHPNRIIGLPVGGDFQVYALQFRIPLTDKLALIATKDGYIDFNPDATLQQDEGFANVSAGLKYAVFENDDVIVTPGFTYEIPIGTQGVFQGEGDGIFRPFVSAGWEPTEKLNILGNFGASVPLGDDLTNSLDYHLHFGYELTETFMPLVEFHGITYTQDADTRPGQLPFIEGGDLLNLGSTDVAGNTQIIGAAGARFQIADGISLGATYGFPMNDQQDIYEYRITTDLTIEF